ncbi:MAG TPA: hypothetical protein VIX89_09615 [Bryobacteraceae bacterium]
MADNCSSVMRGMLIASAGRQWGIPLVTADFRDYAVIDDLDVLPIG